MLGLWKRLWRWMTATTPPGFSPIFAYLMAAQTEADRRARETFALSFLREIHHPDLDGYLRGMHGLVSTVADRVNATTERLRRVEDAVVRIQDSAHLPPTVEEVLREADDEDGGTTTLSMSR